MFKKLLDHLPCLGLPTVPCWSHWAAPPVDLPHGNIDPGEVAGPGKSSHLEDHTRNIKTESTATFAGNEHSNALASRVKRKFAKTCTKLYVL
jgi:hypothetical protein